MKINKLNISFYFGVIILYLKLFFIEPIYSFGSININYSHLILALVFLRVTFYSFTNKLSLFDKNKPINSFWIYILIFTISSFLFFSEIAQGILSSNLQLFLIFLIFVDFKSFKTNEKKLEKYINHLNYFALINVLLTTYTYFIVNVDFAGEVFRNENYTRAFGLMGDQLPWFLSFFAIYSLYNNNKLNFVLNTIGILFSASLGASFIWFVGVLVHLFTEKKKYYFLIVRLSVAFFGIMLIVLVSPNSFNKLGLLQRVENGDFSGYDSRTSGHRYLAYNNAISSFSKRPIFGHGNYSLTMFNKHNLLLAENEKSQLTYLTSPNNQLLSSLTDYGVFGTIFFILFVIRIIKNIGRGRDNDIKSKKLKTFKKASYVWLIVFVLFNQTAVWFLPGSFLWLLICLIISVNYKINRIYGI